MTFSFSINFKPLLFVFLFIVVLIFVGFIWDNVRTQAKLNKIGEHAQAIYKAHPQEFAEIASFKEPLKAGRYLNQINAPEKGVYRVRVVRKADNKWKLISINYYSIPYYDQPANERELSEEEKTLFEKVADDRDTTTTTDALLNTEYDSQDNLYAIVPIHSTETSAFLVISTKRTRNL
ncbi:MAG: hypothetical protein Q7S03_00615 [bacterium]|nr:hypothetical protein [bacterium]